MEIREYRKFTPDELKWIRSLERVMKKAPNTLFIFIAGGMFIFCKDEFNERYMTESGSMDADAPCQTISSEIEMDGGDF